MSFELSDTQLSIIDSVHNIMKKFDDDYWLGKNALTTSTSTANPPLTLL